VETIKLNSGSEFKTNPWFVNEYPILRTIKYSGNKIRLLPAIVSIAKLTVDGGSVLDLMAGTHCVGYALKNHFRIYANDIQRYSYVIGKAFVENGGYSVNGDLAKRELLDSIKKNRISGEFNLFQKLYSDTYFSAVQCMEIDDIRAAIEKVPSPRKELYLTILMSSMCYASNTTGHFAEFLHNQQSSARSVQELFFRKCENLSVEPNKYSNAVFNLDYTSFLSGEEHELSEIVEKCDLIYLDPPYSSAQYSRFYHILETLVRYDYPLVEHNGRYRKDRYFSNFCRKSKAKSELEFLLGRCSSVTSGFVLLSYVDSSSSLIPKNDVVDIVKNHFEFSTEPIICKISHSKLGNGTAKKVEEYLILATNSKARERIVRKLDSCCLGLR